MDTKAHKCAYVDVVVVGQDTRITSREKVSLQAQSFSLFSHTHLYIHWGGGLGVGNRHQHLDQEWENSEAGGGGGDTPSLFSKIVLNLADFLVGSCSQILLLDNNGASFSGAGWPWIGPSFTSMLYGDAPRPWCGGP